MSSAAVYDTKDRLPKITNSEAVPLWSQVQIHKIPRRKPSLLTDLAVLSDGVDPYLSEPLIRFCRAA